MSSPFDELTNKEIEDRIAQLDSDIVKAQMKVDDIEDQQHEALAELDGLQFTRDHYWHYLKNREKYWQPLEPKEK